ncbi:MAG: transcriptional regulator [Lachnospiraceae bacterium]|nr:transcriptional regulator [Lachnospiraceae bacterium]
MKKIQDERRLFTAIFDMLEAHMGKDTELVLHDLNNENSDYEHTIIDIRNGHITGRTVGGSGTDDGLTAVRGIIQSPDASTEFASTADGHILRCTSQYIHDEKQKVIGSICINQDLSRALAAEQYLHDYNLHESSDSTAFVTDIYAAMNDFIQEAFEYIGKPAEEMTREDMKRFVQYLDKRGVFTITKSSTKICNMLNISKYTLYKYLGRGSKGGTVQ